MQISYKCFSSKENFAELLKSIDTNYKAGSSTIDSDDILNGVSIESINFELINSLLTQIPSDKLKSVGVEVTSSEVYLKRIFRNRFDTNSSFPHKDIITKVVSPVSKLDNLTIPEEEGSFDGRQFRTMKQNVGKYPTNLPLYFIKETQFLKSEGLFNVKYFYKDSSYNIFVYIPNEGQPPTEKSNKKLATILTKF